MLKKYPIRGTIDENYIKILIAEVVVKKIIPLILLVFGVFACIVYFANSRPAGQDTSFQISVGQTTTVVPVNVPVTSNSVSLAVVGDFDGDYGPSAKVASAIAAANPNYILTVGDNGHGLVPYDKLSPIYVQYHDQQKMFPALGNHDLYGSNYVPYDMNNLPFNQYYTYLNGSRYYSHVFGNGLVEVFFLNSNVLEPDGNTVGSKQALWLENAMQQSTAKFKIVILHEPPYVSCDMFGKNYNGNPSVRWPFAQWGADLVLSGHCHIYERLRLDGIPYVVDGIGGGGAVNGLLNNPLPQSIVRKNGVDGYTYIVATDQSLNISVITTGGSVIDSFVINK